MPRTTGRFTVNAYAFRRAIQAVLPFVATGRDAERRPEATWVRLGTHQRGPVTLGVANALAWVMTRVVDPHQRPHGRSGETLIQGDDLIGAVEDCIRLARQHRGKEIDGKTVKPRELTLTVTLHRRTAHFDSLVCESTVDTSTRDYPTLAQFERLPRVRCTGTLDGLRQDACPSGVIAARAMAAAKVSANRLKAHMSIHPIGDGRYALRMTRRPSKRREARPLPWFAVVLPALDATVLAAATPATVEADPVSSSTMQTPKVGGATRAKGKTSRSTTAKKGAASKPSVSAGKPSKAQPAPKPTKKTSSASKAAGGKKADRPSTPLKPTTMTKAERRAAARERASAWLVTEVNRQRDPFTKGAIVKRVARRSKSVSQALVGGLFDAMVANDNLVRVGRRWATPQQARALKAKAMREAEAN